MIRTIRCYKLNKIYYAFANLDISTKYLKVINGKVRNVVNRFIKLQCLQKNFIYDNSRNVGQKLPCIEDEYTHYKVHNIANLISTEEGKRILIGYFSFTKKRVSNHDFIGTLEKALEHLKINCLD
jgi:hypothetical protein